MTMRSHPNSYMPPSHPYGQPLALEYTNASSPAYAMPIGNSTQEDVYIALMGCTGSGKSSFIQLCTGEDAGVGHNLKSCTTQVQEYSFVYRGRYRIHLIDTPGFDDTNRSDADVLRDIAGWMGTAYKQEVLLSGIIYLHRISDPRMTGTARRNLRMFKKLCGVECFPKIVLASTFWSDVRTGVGVEHERELSETEDFWGFMLNRGSSMMRHTSPDDQGSAFAIIQHILDRGQDGQRVPLAIQREMVDQGADLHSTSAGRSMEEELKHQREHFEQEIQHMIQETEEALRERDYESAREIERERRAYERRLEQSRQQSSELKINLDGIQTSMAKRMEDLQKELDDKQAEIEEISHRQTLLRTETDNKKVEKYKAQKAEFQRQAKGVLGRLTIYYQKASTWLSENPEAQKNIKSAARVATTVGSAYIKKPVPRMIVNALVSGLGSSNEQRRDSNQRDSSQRGSRDTRRSTRDDTRR